MAVVPSVASNVTLTTSPGALALLDGSLDSGQPPLYVLPHVWLEVNGLTLTDIVSAAAPTDASEAAVAWFSLFKLARNATLLLSDLTAYSNPGDLDEVGTFSGFAQPPRS